VQGGRLSARPVIDEPEPMPSDEAGGPGLVDRDVPPPDEDEGEGPRLELVHDDPISAALTRLGFDVLRSPGDSRLRGALLRLGEEATGLDPLDAGLLEVAAAEHLSRLGEPRADALVAAALAHAKTALAGNGSQALASAAVAPAPAFRLLDDVEIEAESEPEWQIADVLPADAFAVLYGPSEGGKSFLALDWALSVASGQPWRSRRVTGGPVLFVVAEGWSGIRRRVCAWKQARGVSGRIGVCFLSGAVNLMDWTDVTRLLAAIRQKLGCEPVLCVFDTLNQSLSGGDENASKDMGLVIANAQQLRRATGATVVLVHHCRRQDEQERGHGSLRNAADTMLSLAMGDDDARVLTCTKQRNAGYFEPIRFSLAQQGDSLVVVDPLMGGSGLGQSLTKSQEQALAVLRDLATDDGGVPFSRWEKASGLKERTFAVAAKGLTDAGRVTKTGRGRTTRYHLLETGGDRVPL